MIQSLIILLVFIVKSISRKQLYKVIKGLINIQNIKDNECFEWSTVRNLNPANYRPARITKADKELTKKLDFKDIKFPVKIRHIHNFFKKKSIYISVFGYENKENIKSMHQKNVVKKKHVDLLTTGKEGKKHYVLIKDFNTFKKRYFGKKHFLSLLFTSF